MAIYALSAGEYSQQGREKIGRSTVTAEELRKDLQGLPEDSSLVFFHGGKAAAVEYFRKDGPEAMRIKAGTYKKTGAYTASMGSRTTGELLEALKDVPGSCRVYAYDGLFSAAIYGGQKMGA